MYTHQTLDPSGSLAAIEKKTVHAHDVRQVLTCLETGNADARAVPNKHGSPFQKVKPKPTDPATILCRWPQSIGLRSGYRWPPV